MVVYRNIGGRITVSRSSDKIIYIYTYIYIFATIATTTIDSAKTSVPFSPKAKEKG